MYRTTIAVMFTLCLLAQATGSPATAADDERANDSSKTPDCVYVGTPYDVIDAMLDAGSIRRSDVVYDLGCGDGRIIVAAAKRFGCHGVGYDVDPQRIKECHENVRKQKVEKLVEIKQEDIFSLDLSDANVIMLYLLPEMNARLVPQLKMLPPGARVVTHNYSIEGIAHKDSYTVKSLEDGVNHYLYLYEAPLKEEAKD
ncbi:MAG: class I SAM-dependent methyltransferase [Thermoguttaceae bacterium]